MRVPPESAQFEQSRGQDSVEFVEGNLVQIRERSIDDDHIYKLSQVSRRNSTQRATIHANFAPEAHLSLAEGEHLLSVLSDVVWIGRRIAAQLALATSIASIVPAHHIDVLLQKEAQVVRMRVVNHVLVVHGVWVAQDERR